MVRGSILDMFPDMVDTYGGSQGIVMSLGVSCWGTKNESASPEGGTCADAIPYGVPTDSKRV